MRYYLEAPLVLHGAVVTSFTHDEFFDFCQANPNLRIERNVHA